MLDSFGRNITYARISVTDLCNLRCIYCMPESGVCKMSHDDILRVSEIVTIAKVLTDLGVDKVRLTGGEPLVRRGITEIVKQLGQIEKIKDFSMTTNGILLPKYIDKLKAYRLSRVNISLDTLIPEKYSKITRGGNINDVFKGLYSALDSFDKVKINMALIKGFNDDEIGNFVNLTLKYPIDVRFIELMPIGTQADWSKNKYISNEVVLEKIPLLEKISNEDVASPATYYKLPNSIGRIGLINSLSCKFCHNCNRIRITSDGKIKSCLHSDEEIDLKALTNDENALKEKILEAINDKQESHSLVEGKYIKRNMFRIGG